MSPERLDALAAYVRGVADAVELRDWRFRVEGERPAFLSIDAAAACRPTRGRRFAALWFSDGWWDGSPEERRQTVVHELLHCHFRPVDAVVEGIQTNLGDAAWGVFDAAYQDAQEYAIDAVAEALARGLPLPPEVA